MMRCIAPKARGSSDAETERKKNPSVKGSKGLMQEKKDCRKA